MACSNTDKNATILTQMRLDAADRGHSRRGSRRAEAASWQNPALEAEALSSAADDDTTDVSNFL